MFDLSSIFITAYWAFIRQRFFSFYDSRLKTQDYPKQSTAGEISSSCDCGFFSDDNPNHHSSKLYETVWFTNKDYVEQFNDLVLLIKRLHFDCEIIIAFVTR